MNISQFKQSARNFNINIRLYCTLIALGFSISLFSSSLLLAADDLAQGFQNPPETTKPWCYWYWISDNISKEGITNDLQAMHRIGIGEALIGNIFMDKVLAGDAKVLSEKWWQLVEHAIRQAHQEGVNIGMFNCPGWSQSGGPWIKPGQSMRYLLSSETRVQGPSHFSQKLPLPPLRDLNKSESDQPDDKSPPRTFSQDVAVIAFRAPQADADCLADHSPKVTCTPAADGANLMFDGNLDTSMTFPKGAGSGAGKFIIEISLDKPLTARHLDLIPSDKPWSADCDLQISDDGDKFRTVRKFRFDRSNMKIHVGPMPRGPVTISFPPVTSKRFRLVFSNVTSRGALAEIQLSPAARLESYVEKQLGKMCPTPAPKWDTYLWPQQTEPDLPTLKVSSGQIINLSSKMTNDGFLDWQVPSGQWIIQRVVMTPTGTRNAPASPEGEGLEVDKMNRSAVKEHFKAFIGQVLRRIPADERKAFKHVVADSYEMGSENWTDGFGEKFQNRYGYDPIPWLGVLTGRIVSSAELSDRFLWDLRRLVADRIARDYVGGLRDLCRENGLKLWLENYGHWGFPAEFLQYGGQSELIGGEFWVKGLGQTECRAASSAANIYGKPFVSAEAFTSAPSHFNTVPADLKARGDWCFCQGINHFVLHVYIQQPWPKRRPGVNAWFGTEFNRNNTWFEQGKAWVDYLRRCCFMLQQGTRVADVAYFIGEDTPKMTGICNPKLPAGYDFDYINAEVIEERMSVKDGRLVLPHGTSYRVLVLADQETMRPELLKKICALIEGGATIVGKAPSRSPSMENYPQCDLEVKRLAEKIWGEKLKQPQGGRRLGKGRVVWGEELKDVLDKLDVRSDFLSTSPLRYTHRSAGNKEIYFLANPNPQEVATLATFRVSGRKPQLWCPKTGRIERPAVYQQSDTHVQLPIELGPAGSVFVVFSEEPASDKSIVSVQRGDEIIIDASKATAEFDESGNLEPGEVMSNFTLALWAKPSAETTLVGEHNSGVFGMNEPRNDAISATHGGMFASEGHAGCGLAIGQNGVCVFEHAASYFAPPLVYKGTINDWTHIAVVYNNNQPNLYLNGKPVHTGLKSNHVVHPGILQESFQGKLGAVKQIARSLQEDEVAELMQSMPRPDMKLPSEAVKLTEAGDDKIIGHFKQPGTYTLRNAQGQTKQIEIAAVPAAVEIAGPWQVTFKPSYEGPKEATFDNLTDWTKHADEDIKYFAGKATYRKVFTVSDLPQGGELCLDLGDVRGLATIRLNGNDLGTLWIAPWRVKVTSAVQKGENVLEVDVVNTWCNRLVGDSKLAPEKRHTYLAWETIPENLPLQPAGLLGPVELKTVETRKITFP